jgi:hypothetical protein
VKRLEARWFAVIAIALLLPVAALELGARAFYFVKEGFNPYYLTYGVVADIGTHSTEYQGYTKFPANSVQHYVMSATKTIEMQINADGFRNPFDFETPKPAGVTRIVSMGASSTFGYTGQDDETYPVELAAKLNGRAPSGRRFEVFNLGIPHFRIEEIVALARAELAALEPDIVTLYAGYNNSMVYKARTEGSTLYRLKDWIYGHSVAWRGIHPMVAELYYRLTQALNRDVVGVPNLMIPVTIDRSKVDETRQQIRSEFAAQLREFSGIVEAAGARLVLVTQSYTLHGLQFGLNDRWRSYAQEVAHVESMLTDTGEIPAPFTTLLAHRDLMTEFETWAAQNQLTLVDGIGALDGDREAMMATFVHLTPAGNERLAAAIHRALIADGTATGPARP